MLFIHLFPFGMARPSDIPVQIRKNFCITGLPIQAVPYLVFHLHLVYSPGRGHRSMELGLYGLRRCMIVLCHRTPELHFRSPPITFTDTEEHSVGQIEKTTVICLEANLIQCIIDLCE